MAMNIVRGNTGTMPTSQQPSGSVLPADLAALVDYMQPVIQKFRDNSSPLDIMLDQQILKIGGTATLRISSTGLGERTLHKISGTIALKNTAGTAQVVSFSPEFPYNIVGFVNTQINGNTSITNATPLGYVMEQARRNRNFAMNPMDKRQCTLTAGANLTLTAGAPSFSGYTGCSIAANQTGILNFEFFFEVPYVLNKDTLIGLLPLQNNSTFATITYNMAGSMIGENGSSPMFVSGGVPSTLSYDSANSSMLATPRYDFWAVPADLSLYQNLILNSFQVIEQPGNTFSSTGTSALQFQFPLNSYLLAAFFVVRNSTAVLVETKDVFSAVRLEYNGNVTPFKTDFSTHVYNQFTDYGSNPFNQFGTVLWDGTNTGDQLNFSDSTGWVDLYNTSNPTFYADVKSGSITLPATYSFIRTQIVPSDVRVIPN